MSLRKQAFSMLILPFRLRKTRYPSIAPKFDKKTKLGIFFYQVFRLAYYAGIHIASLWNKKAGLWVKRRKNWQQQLSVWRKTIPANAKITWMHCASLGEFEQGRPVLEALRQQYPSHYILLSFFSPSGYEVRKQYAGADHVICLPADHPHNARAFVDIVKPSLAIWVKYEYWYYFLKTLHARRVPLLLVSGIFRPTQPFFKWYGHFWRKMLRFFSHLFVQTARSAELLEEIGLKENVTIAGDTRFDRVAGIVQNWQPPAAFLSDFCHGHRVLVAGSTWEEDEELLIHYARIYPDYRFIIAPHEVSPERIADLQKEFPQAILYTGGGKNIHADANVLIVDIIGTLSRLYHYGDICFIGGGFNSSGIHNTLEAAVYGRPVIFGPVYEKFSEAVALVEAGAAYSIENALELEALLNELFADEAKRRAAGNTAAAYVAQQQGATAMITNYVAEKRLLIN